MSAENTRISTKGWNLDSLISLSANFCSVDRIPLNSTLLPQVLRDHERKGVPLVVEGFHRHKNWPEKFFTIEGFAEFSELNEISVRNVHSWTDKVMKYSDFITKSRQVGPFAEPGETERLYGKDAQCPHAWEKWLQDGGVLPPSLLSHGIEDEFRFRPVTSRIETLMCYLGIGDTYTPCHKDLCASSGHNLMCYTENNGSSFWFMSKSSSAPKASAYFHQLGYELDHENLVVTLEQLRCAPYKVYILEQRLGDLVLVPPRSCHQVVNYGGITVKTSWSRMTLEGLSTAYHHELPIYRRVGRPETYRIKSTIYYALKSRTRTLEYLCSQLPDPSSGSSFTDDLVNAINSAAQGQSLRTPDSEIEHLAKDLMKLLHLYDLILAEEMPSLELNARKPLETTFNDDDRIVCDFCDCDIFQSFFECSQCMGGSSSGCIVCPGCFSEGRSCQCGTMQPMQCRKFRTLIDARLEGHNVLRQYLRKGGTNNFSSYNQLEDCVPKFFQAACLVWQASQNKNGARKCSRNPDEIHDVPSFWAKFCPLCHRSTCFEHLLKNSRLHSVEAILLFDAENTRARYHQSHMLSHKRYVENLHDLEESQKEGSPVSGLLLLTHITFQYSHRFPSNPKSLMRGWYDPVQEETSNQRIPPSKSLEETTKLTISIPARKASFSGPQSRPKKRRIYVDVPPAPYPIPSRLSRISNHKSEASRPPSPNRHPRSSQLPTPSHTSIQEKSVLKVGPPKGKQRFGGSQLTSPLSFHVVQTATSTSPRSPSKNLFLPTNLESQAPTTGVDNQIQPRCLSSEDKSAVLGSSPLHGKYLEPEATKHGLDIEPENTACGILTAGIPDGSSLRQAETLNNYATARFVPPHEALTSSAREISDFLNLI